MISSDIKRGLGKRSVFSMEKHPGRMRPIPIFHVVTIKLPQCWVCVLLLDITFSSLRVRIWTLPWRSLFGVQPNSSNIPSVPALWVFLSFMTHCHCCKEKLCLLFSFTLCTILSECYFSSGTSGHQMCGEGGGWRFPHTK